jgi:hypothetical protein
MSYVPVPKDISKVKVKVLFGLTKRQILCFGLGAVFGIPFFLLTRKTLGNEASMILMVVIMMPFFFLGMFEKNGLPAELVARNIIRHAYWPGVRPYKTENLYEIISESEAEQIGGKTGGGKNTRDGKKGAKPTPAKYGREREKERAR